MTIISADVHPSFTIHQSPNATSPQQTCLEYDTVLKRDTCYDMASRNGIRLEMLLEWNAPKLDCSRLFIGQKLCVHRYIYKDPSSKSDRRPSFIDPSLCMSQWTVGPTDTCYKISTVSQVPLKKILEINAHSLAGFNCSHLTVGSIVCLGGIMDEGHLDDDFNLNDGLFDTPSSSTHHSLSKRYYRKVVKRRKSKIQPYRPRPQPQAKKYHSPAPSANKKSYSDEGALAETNQARKAVGVAPLSWDHDLAAHAQKYSQYLASQGCQLVHSHEKGQGENLYASYGSSSNSLGQAVRLWLREKWEQGQGSLNHFTQVVWSGTKTMGCAKGVNKDKNCQVVTCRYNPPGNVIGRRPY